MVGLVDDLYVDIARVVKDNVHFAIGQLQINLKHTFV